MVCRSSWYHRKKVKGLKFDICRLEELRNRTVHAGFSFEFA
jgi:hypothetical protein